MVDLDFIGQKFLSAVPIFTVSKFVGRFCSCSVCHQFQFNIKLYLLICNSICADLDTMLWRR